MTPNYENYYRITDVVCEFGAAREDLQRLANELRVKGEPSFYGEDRLYRKGETSKDVFLNLVQKIENLLSNTRGDLISVELSTLEAAFIASFIREKGSEELKECSGAFSECPIFQITKGYTRVLDAFDSLLSKEEIEWCRKYINKELDDTLRHVKRLKKWKA